MKNTESLKKETDKLSHYADHVDRENESDRAFENTNEIQNTEPEEDTANKDENNCPFTIPYCIPSGSPAGKLCL